MRVLSLAATYLAVTSTASAFAPSSPTAASAKTTTSRIQSTTESAASAESTTSTPPSQDPLLIRAAKGQKVERTPVWMMRQAGRHIAEYRELCKKWPTFRERSEIPEVAVEVSLQPWRNYQTDGCILFSDILTPLPGMGVEFDIDEKVGPVVEPMRSWESVEKVRLTFCYDMYVVIILLLVRSVKSASIFNMYVRVYIYANNIDSFHSYTLIKIIT